MPRQWQTFVRRFGDMAEGEVEIFIKDLSPGPRKYDTKHVRAKVARKKETLPDGDLLWIRSESGMKADQPWYIQILEELPPSVKGRPWEDVFHAIERSAGKKAK